MFKVGEFVSYGYVGTCQVEKIEDIDMDGSRKKKKCYVIRPVSDQKRTIYCPVDNERVSIRKNLSSEETYDLLKKLPSMELFQFSTKKDYETICKTAVHSANCEDWLRLIKTLVYERKIRTSQGRKVTSTNTRYLKDAENKLYWELAIALQQDISLIHEMMGKILEEETT